MRTPVYSTRFKEEYKLMQIMAFDKTKIDDVIRNLIDGTLRHSQNVDNELKGDYTGYRVCDIDAGWVLIYKISESEVTLLRTGIYSDLLMSKPRLFPIGNSGLKSVVRHGFLQRKSLVYPVIAAMFAVFFITAFSLVRNIESNESLDSGFAYNFETIAEVNFVPEIKLASFDRHNIRIITEFGNYSLTNNLEIEYQKNIIERIEYVKQTARSRFAPPNHRFTVNVVNFATVPINITYSSGLNIFNYYPFYEYLNGINVFVAFNGKLPIWICSGLEDYLFSNGDITRLSAEEIKRMLTAYKGEVRPAFGDAWFIPGFFEGQCLDESRVIAYSIVSLLTESGEIYSLIYSGLNNRDDFIRKSNIFMNQLLGDSFTDTGAYYFYTYGNGLAIYTSQARYEYSSFRHEFQDSIWTYANFSDFTRYMEESLEFIKEFLEVDELCRRLIVELNGHRRNNFPPNVYQGGRTIVNFVNDLGPAAFTHNAMHTLLHLTGETGAPSSFFANGLAEFVAILFDEQYDGPIRYYSKASAYYSIIMAENFVRMSEYNEARTTWQISLDNVHAFTATSLLGRASGVAHAEAASFVNYLYYIYGREKLLEAQRANFRFDRVREIYGKSLADLSEGWMRHIWPDGVPEWWFG